MIYLENHNAIITGGASGLGLAISTAFVKSGASVSICGTNQEKLLATQSELLNLKQNDNQKIFIHQTDVSIEEEVKIFIENSIKQLGHVNTLVNNAAIYGPKGLSENIDATEWMKTMSNNMFSVFLTCKYILPHMKSRNTGNIINLSGGGEKPFPRFSAYATSKAAVVKFSEVLAEEVRQNGISVNSIAPGAMNTALLDEVLDSNPDIVGQDFFEKCVQQKENGGIDPNIAAKLCLYLSSSNGKKITGKLISAIWDDWENMHNNLESIDGTNLYTMRRIV